MKTETKLELQGGRSYVTVLSVTYVTKMPHSVNFMRGKHLFKHVNCYHSCRGVGRGGLRLHAVKREHTSRPRDGCEQGDATTGPFRRTLSHRARELPKHWGSCSNYKTVRTPQRLIFPLTPQTGRGRGSSLCFITIGQITADALFMRFSPL